MATSLFHDIVYGPIHSRRLGISLGINLSPPDGKRCTFNCIYCQCGLNEERLSGTGAPRRAEVSAALEAKLLQMQAEYLYPDVITFSGNGEPTLHPAFAGIVDDTLAIRNRLCPRTKVAALSNSTMIWKPKVFGALNRLDERIMKFDSAIDARLLQIDQPELPDFTCEQLVRQLCRFDGQLSIQTIFLRGEHRGATVDNTGEEEVTAWLNALTKINPRKVMIYTIDRDTPIESLHKVSKDELDAIAARVRTAGFDVSVSA